MPRRARRGGSAGGLEQGALVAVGTVGRPVTQGATKGLPMWGIAHFYMET